MAKRCKGHVCSSSSNFCKASSISGATRFADGILQISKATACTGHEHSNTNMTEFLYSGLGRCEHRPLSKTGYGCTVRATICKIRFLKTCILNIRMRRTNRLSQRRFPKTCILNLGVKCTGRLYKRRFLKTCASKVRMSRTGPLCKRRVLSTCILYI